jgi:hypothetical protein
MAHKEKLIRMRACVEGIISPWSLTTWQGERHGSSQDASASLPEVSPHKVLMGVMGERSAYGDVRTAQHDDVTLFGYHFVVPPTPLIWFAVSLESRKLFVFVVLSIKNNEITRVT